MYIHGLITDITMCHPINFDHDLNIVLYERTKKEAEKHAIKEKNQKGKERIQNKMNECDTCQKS